MADKFRVTFPIPVTMARGEQPSAEKLNSISTQAKNGLALVERALGDIWTQSGDATMGSEPLQITTLARALGQQLYNNAVFQKPDLAINETIRLNQSIVSQRGQSELRLDFKPENDATLVAELNAAGFTNQVSNRENISANIDWYLDQNSGIIYLGAPFPIDDTPAKNNIDYNVLAENWPSDGSSESAYNVIPHPEMEDDWRGLKFVKLDNNKYLIYLPVRRPLKLNASALGKIPREAENSVLPASSPVHRYWYTNSSNWTNPADITTDAGSFAIATARRYRHKLPDLIYTLVTTGALGATIPSGSMFLWDNTQNTILEGLTFKVPEQDVAYGGGLRPGWVIQVEGATLDNLLASGTDYTSTLNTDNPSDYKQRFSIITTGESVAKKGHAFSTELISQTLSLGIQPRLSHDALLGVNPVARDGNDTYTAPPATYREGDDHSAYLSREGSTSDIDSQRDRYNNAILGDLLLAASSGSTRQGTGVTSQAVSWGDVDSGPRLFYNPLTGQSIVDSSGTVVPNGNALQLNNYPLYLARRTLLFGNSPNNLEGLTYDDGPNLFRLFADSDVNRAALSLGEIVVVGSNYDVSTVQTDYKGLDLARWVRLLSSGTQNLLEFRGAFLDLSAVTGDTNDVRVGGSNTNTYLNLANRRLIWGSNSDYIDFNDGTNEWSFIENGDVNNSKIRAGVLKATNNEVWLNDSENYGITLYNSLAGYVLNIISGGGVNVTVNGGTMTVDGVVKADLGIGAGTGGYLGLGGGPTTWTQKLMVGADPIILGNGGNVALVENDETTTAPLRASEIQIASTKNSPGGLGHARQGRITYSPDDRWFMFTSQTNTVDNDEPIRAASLRLSQHSINFERDNIADFEGTLSYDSGNQIFTFDSAGTGILRSKNIRTDSIKSYSGSGFIMRHRIDITGGIILPNVNSDPASELLFVDDRHIDGAGPSGGGNDDYGYWAMPRGYGGRLKAVGGSFIRSSSSDPFFLQVRQRKTLAGGGDFPVNSPNLFSSGGSSGATFHNGIVIDYGTAGAVTLSTSVTAGDYQYYVLVQVANGLTTLNVRELWVDIIYDSLEDALNLTPQ